MEPGRTPEWAGRGDSLEDEFNVPAGDGNDAHVGVADNAASASSPRPRGIMRAVPTYTPPNASSSLLGGMMGGRAERKLASTAELKATGLPTTAASQGGGRFRRRRREVPQLSALARDALLFGLADGRETVLSEVPQRPPSHISLGFPGTSGEELAMADVVLSSSEVDDTGRAFDCGASDKGHKDGSTKKMVRGYVDHGSSSLLLHSEQFWDDLLAETRRRRILSDAFLTALCASGLPPPRLELRGGLGDAGVTDRWLAKAPPRQSQQVDEGAGAGPGRTTQATFASASEMVLASLRHLHLSGERSKGGRAISLFMDRCCPLERGHESGSVVERLPLASDFEAFLHRVARSSRCMEGLHLGPGLLRQDSGNKWLGALKAITANCSALKSLEIERMSLGPSGRDFAVEGTDTGSTRSVNDLFEAMAANCVSLENLSLSRCGGVQDRHIQALLLEQRDGSATVPHLRDLDLSYTGVGGLSFAALCSRRPPSPEDFGSQAVPNYIRKLNLDGTDISVAWLGRILASMGDNLEELSLLECPQLIGAGSGAWSAIATAAAAKGDEQDAQQSCLCILSSLNVELCFELSDIMESNDDTGIRANVAFVDGRDRFEEAFSAVTVGAPDVKQSESTDIENVWWTCRRCTLFNDPSLHRCAACDGRRWNPPVCKDVDPSSTDELRQTKVAAFEPMQERRQKTFGLKDLKRIPLKTFAALLHLRKHAFLNEDSDYNYVGRSSDAIAQGATALIWHILDALPWNMVDLSLFFPIDTSGHSEIYGYSSEGSFHLEKGVCSLIQDKFYGTLQSLELGPVCLTDVAAFGILMRSLQGLKTLKLFGSGSLGVPTASVLREIFPPPGKRDSFGQYQGLEILQVICFELEEHAWYEPPAQFVSSVFHGKSNAHENQDVTIASVFLKRLWLQGCRDLKALDVSAPLIERLTIANCSALSSLNLVDLEDCAYGDGDEASGCCLQHLRISNCANLSPYSVSSMHLPRLTHLDVDGLILIEDWEFSSLVASACTSLTSLRLNQCRSLGNFALWRDHGVSFHPLSVLHIRQPSLALNLAVLQSLFESTSTRHPAQQEEMRCCLRDLIIEDAAGIKGNLCAPSVPASDAVLSEGRMESRYRSGAYVEREADQLSKKSALFLHDGLQVATTGMQSTRSVERLLTSFVERAHGGGDSELSFPPTLTSYQRKLVHEVAEEMNLEHESIRLHTGVKFVRVRRLDSAGVIDDNVDLEALNEANVGVEDSISGLDSRLQAQQLADESQLYGIIGVTFALDGEAEDEDIHVVDDDTIFRMDEEVNAATKQDERDSSIIVQNWRPPTAQSRRQKRKARKAAKKGGDASDDEVEASDASGSDSENEDDVAFDPLLQCERFARFDPKIYRRLTSLAHKLPTDSESGNTVCLRYLRGVCPYQEAKNGGDCRYAHFEVRSSQQKKFDPLLEYVCGKAEEAAVKRRNSKRRSHRQMYSSNSLAKATGSHRIGDIVNNTDLHSENGKKGRKAWLKGRKGSISEENDYEWDGLSRSYGTDEGISDDGTSSRGASPARSGIGASLSSSPGASALLDERAPSGFIGYPLKLQRLLSLELIECSAITAACLDGPCLVRISLRGCTKLNLLDLRAPVLSSLDLSECVNLSSVPLHGGSLRRLRVANLTRCKNLHEDFMSKLVNHARDLRQLHIFGSGATDKGRNVRERQRIKTKTAFLTKITAGRPELEVVTTKKKWRVMRAKRKGAASSRSEEEEGPFSGTS